MASINTNSLSLGIQNQKKRTLSVLGQSIERLSTGGRINSAKDDAAGQAITNRLTANINGLNQAARNANDGISLSQTAQGALDEINARLHRIRELTVQGLNDTYKGDTGDSIQAEINLNLKEIDRLNTSAAFNGISLLDGLAGTTSLHVGANDHETLDIDLGPPGFSVVELGLLDFTVQGAPATMSPVNTLTGYSHQINIDDTLHTTVAYSPPENSPNMVTPSRPGSLDVVQLNGAGGRLMNAPVYATHDTETRLNTVNIGVTSAVVGNTAQESISSWRFLDSSGNALSLEQQQVVSTNGKYWIQSSSQGRHYYIEAELTIDGDQHRMTVQAKNTALIPEYAMSGHISDPLYYAPAVAKNGADYRLTFDGVDESGNASLALVHLGGYYYVEEQLGADQYAYYRADVTIKTGGAQNSIRVTSDRSQGISVNDQPYVSGYSVAHLAPENHNVQVNYVDLAGGLSTDVMRDDGVGGYVLDVDEFSDGTGGTKTAKVVRNQDGDYLLQTVNGSGEVILYYPMSFSVATDVEQNQTILTLTESDVAQRLRTPADPLAAIDRAIARVDAKRGELGALDNRLSSVIENNTSTSRGLMASRSQIQDADYAAEITQMTRSQIVQQASTSLLAQANQWPETILTLLKA